MIVYAGIHLSATDFMNRFRRSIYKKSHPKAATEINLSKQRKIENKKLFCTITVIVLTDVVMWFVMSIIALMYWEKYNVHYDEKLTGLLRVYTWFHSVLFCLTPINSVLNPFIYFNHYWSTSFKLLKKRLTDSFRKQ